MSTRNKLLESIVLALGGTVTNPNNRNQLLEDWLNAVSQPVTRLAPNFNGVSQYGVIDVDLNAGDFFEFDFIPSALVDDDFFTDGEVGSQRSFILTQSGTLRFNDSVIRLFLDDVEITNLSTPYPNDGLRHKLKAVVISTCKLNTVATNQNLNQPISCVIFNLKVNDGSVYNYPMDDGWANNPVMRNIGSGADGTFINMTEAAWVEIPS